MKKILKNSLLLLASSLMVFSFTACNDENTGDPNDNLYQLIMRENQTGERDAEYKTILQEYVDGTVVPTYKALAEAALQMRTANESLKANQSATTIKAAANAWMEARIWWELSEAFLFGPVGENALDIDGHIDSWPLDKNEIDAVLATDAVGMTGAVAWKMDAEVIGFHVTEYLLFRDGQPRPSLTTAELNYLTAATDALIWDCVLAYVAWVGEENVSATMKAVFNENPEVVEALEDNSQYKNFANTIKNATGIYLGNINSAISEIATGAADIADEVGTTKISSPYETGKVEEVESWYSWHSLDDYRNNILSIQNAYLGGLSNSTRPSISMSAFVARINPDLDREIKSRITNCIAKIQAIGKDGKSFYEVVRDQINRAEVEVAVDACEDVAKAFKK